MMNTILFAVLSFLAGAGFVAAGIYFLTPGFLDKLNEATAPEKHRHNEFCAKGSAYVALGLGGLTLVWGGMFLSLPQITAILALIYMFFLVAALAILLLVFK